MNIERVEDIERKLAILRRQRAEFEDRGMWSSVEMLDSMIKEVQSRLQEHAAEPRIPNIGVPAAE